jgi:hypothetical protein
MTQASATSVIDSSHSHSIKHQGDAMEAPLHKTTAASLSALLWLRKMALISRDVSKSTDRVNRPSRLSQVRVRFESTRG